MRHQSQQQLLVGLNPVTRYVNELRKRFGRYAVFFSDEMNQDLVAILWAPMPAMVRAFVCVHVCLIARIQSYVLRIFV